MKTLLILLATLVLFMPVAVAGPTQVTLEVAFYPYVPDPSGLSNTIKAAFERQNPGIVLRLINSHPDPANPKNPPIPLADDYYDDGLANTHADLYEVDTILLQDLTATKLMPVVLPNHNFHPLAVLAVTSDGKTYGVPHWMCGNFLFYRAQDTAVSQAQTLGELRKPLNPADGSGLGVDLKGGSTLGEWYLTALAWDLPVSKLPAAVIKPLDPQEADHVKRLLELCPTGLCRSIPLHKDAGAYARKFVHEDIRAYMGYSETLYYALKEIREKCPSDCISADQIAVRAIPGPADRPGVAWVDAFAMDRSLPRAKLAAAQRFLEFVTSSEAYKAVLSADKNHPSRYLLPAVRLPRAIMKKLDAPLYKPLFAAFTNRMTFSAPGANQDLRSRGKELDCKLAKDNHELPLPAGCK